MPDQETKAKVSILSNENDGMTDPMLRLIGPKGITLVISRELARQIAKLQIDGDNGYCEVGTFSLHNGYETSEERSVASVVISDD